MVEAAEPAGEAGAHALFGPDPDASGNCCVCGEAVTSGASAVCSECGEPYHLVLTNDGEGKNCGEVWLNEEYLALDFACA